MKYRWIAAIIIFLIALTAGAVTYHFMRDSTAASCCSMENQRDDLAWIREEFKLTPDQMQRIENMHATFQIVCERHCDDIRTSRAQLAQARQQKRPATEISTAEAHIAAVDAECKTSTEAHMRAVAAVIGGNEGQRYLALVLPHIGANDHATPSTLDGNTTHDHHAGH